MEKLYLILFAGLFSGFLNAQSISSSVMSASGTSFEAEDFTLHFSIGEPLNTVIEEGDLMISQGVLQIILTEIISEVEEPMQNLFEVYPNPTADIVSINIKDASRKYNYKLFDLNGGLLQQAVLSNQKSSLNVEHLPKGTYLLNILKDGEAYQNLKLIKL